jgi:hypothetical protein
MNQSVLAAFVLWTFAMTLACGGGGQNSNSNASNVGNANSNTANANAVSLAKAFDCDRDTADGKAQAIRTYIENEMTVDKDHKGNLVNQAFEDKPPATKLTFTLTPQWPEPGNLSKMYFDLEFSGLVRGNDNANDRNHPFKKIAEILDKVVKKGCVQNVTFKAPSKHLTDYVDGFQWTACDWPNVPCNGACEPTCNRKGGTNSSKPTNGNTAGNTTSASGNTDPASNGSNANKPSH